MNRRPFIALMLLSSLTLAAPPAFAAGRESADAAAIQKVMKATWDKPDAPLRVEPVVVASDYALAGWLQGNTGGRALLRREHGQWKVIVCGGDGLLKADALVQTGMSPSVARTLSRLATTAEAKLSPAARKQLSLFEGIVRVDGAHGPDAAHKSAHHGVHDKSTATGKSPAPKPH